MTTYFKDGVEFTVSSGLITQPLSGSFTQGGQIAPTVTALPDGRFVVTWSSDLDPQDGSGSAIKLQLFSAAGEKIGSETLVNTETLYSQNQPAVIGLSGGGFVLSWTTFDTAQDGSGNAVKAQLFDASGAKVGGELLVDTLTSGSQSSPELTALAGGGFVATWTSNASGDDDIKAQLFSATGARVGTEFRVNSTATGAQSASDVATLSNGNFVVTWTDSANGGDIRARLFNASGTAFTSDLQVNAFSSSAQSGSSVTALSGGGFVVTWTSAGVSGDPELAVMAQAFDANGVKAGAEFRVNTQAYANQWQPSVTGTSDGGFIIAWRTDDDVFAAGGDGSSAAIKAQVFSSTGAKLGGEFLVNSLGSGYQTVPSLTTLPDGRVVATWANEPSGSGAVTIEAQFLRPNIAPVIDSNGGGDTAQVTATDGQTAVTAVHASDAGGGQAISYAIVGGLDATKFSIDPTSGALVFNSAPHVASPTDSNGDNIYEVTVRASDGELTDTQSLRISVAPANQAPVIISNGGGDAASLSVAENSLAVTTVSATDEGTSPLRYSIVGGTDGNLFAINAQTGVLTFVSAPDHEAPSDANRDNVYEVTVAASDGSFSDLQTLTVTVGNSNDTAPVIALFNSDSIQTGRAENSLSVFDFDASDADGDTVLFSLSGQDAASFTIDQSTGVVNFRAAPDFEAPGSTAGTNDYVFDLIASDGVNSDVLHVSLHVYDVDEAPSISSDGGGATAAITVDEGSILATRVTAADPEGAAVSYAITGGADAGSLVIDSMTGELRFVRAPDHEAAADADGDNVYNVTVTASTTTGSDSQAISISVANVNDAPAIAGGTSQSLTAAENGTLVTTIAGFDPDGDGLSYAIAGGVDAALFAIDASTGVLSFISAPDYEAPADQWGSNFYNVTVTASDGQLSAFQSVQIRVTNVNEGVTVTSPSTFSISENSSSAGVVSATDPDGDAISYAIAGGADAALFAINSQTGALTFITAPNFEAPADADRNNVYDVQVRASDGLLSTTQNVGVQVGNVNEGVSFSPVSTFNVAENNTAVGSVRAVDADGDPVSYAIAGGADGALFAIDAQTGAVSFVAAPNYEAFSDANHDNVYELLVRATDGSLSAIQGLLVQVGNVNEAPVIGSNGGGASASVTVLENTTLATTLSATDPDSNIAYSISGGADAARFTIDPKTGELRFAANPDYEAPADANHDNVYDVVVTASDGMLADAQSLSISVGNTRDGLTLTGANKADTLSGGSAEDTISGAGGADTLFGNGGDDFLNGGDGNDKLTGGLGADQLTGGAGQDVFTYTSLADSTSSAMDKILDFSHAQKDQISLSAIDANSTVAGDQAFSFIGSASFSGRAGQLRSYINGGDTYVTGDVNGDGVGDFVICLDPATTLVASDFLL